MKFSPRSCFIWFAVYALVLATGALVYHSILATTDGHFVYILDDPYIHLAMARNFVFDGVWGVTRYEFSTASSSVLWVLLLAGAQLFVSDATLVPLALNLAFAGALIAIIQYYLQKYIHSTWRVVAVLIVVVFAAPVIVLIFLGMEHILQSVAAVGFIFYAARYISLADPAHPSGENTPRKFSCESMALVMLAALSTLIRYEGLFQIAAVGLYLVVRRLYAVAAMVGVAGMLTPVLYGVYATAHGWPTLPTPVLLKGGFPEIQSLAELLTAASDLIQKKYIEHIYMPVLILLGLFYFVRNHRRGWKIFSFSQILLGMYLLVALQHVHFAGLGWYMRYEAYLVVGGCLILAMHCFGDFARSPTAAENAKNDDTKAGALFENPQRSPRRRAVWGARLAFLFLFVCFARLGVSLGWRALVGVAGPVKSAREIYTQQYQSARFLAKYYTGQSVAANDIGAINYYADIQCLDLYGLGNRDVAALRNQKQFTTANIQTLADQAGVRVAIVYDAWYERAGGLPANWRKVGEWTIPENTTVAQDTVAIYAVGEDPDVVLRQLKEFGASLPPEVKQNFTR